jgi:hypothetical protein
VVAIALPEVQFAMDQILVDGFETSANGVSRTSKTFARLQAQANENFLQQGLGKMQCHLLAMHVLLQRPTFETGREPWRHHDPIGSKSREKPALHVGSRLHICCVSKQQNKIGVWSDVEASGTWQD